MTDQSSGRQAPLGPAFTVCTPTFNRRHTLPRVYESLCAQTLKDLEWLVIDDGSSDGTGDLVHKWAESAPFPIRYQYQDNRGKHAALNEGVRSARGRFFLILDSDDACIPETLERFEKYWRSIPGDVRASFSGVGVHCLDEAGDLVGDLFPQDVMDMYPLEMRYRHDVWAEKWGFHRTDIMRRFPFPEPREPTYVPESVVWDRIGERYLIRYVNDALRIYHHGAEDQISHQVSVRNAVGLALLQATYLSHAGDWFWHDPEHFLRAAANYTRMAFHSGRRFSRLGEDLDGSVAWVLWALMAVPGFVKYRSDLRSRS